MRIARRLRSVLLALVIGCGICVGAHVRAGQVTGVTTDLKVSEPLAGVLVEAFAVDEVGNVAGASFANTRTNANGSFTLPLGDVDRRFVIKFSQAGRTDVFIPNVPANEAAGALVVLANGTVNDLFVIVPKKQICSTPCSSRLRRFRCR